MGFASSVRFHGANFAKLCGRGSNLLDHKIDSQLCFANRLIKVADIVSEFGGRLTLITGVTGTNLLLRKPDCVPSLGFSLVCQGNSSRGDKSGDDNLEFVGACFLELWILLQKAKKELELNDLYKKLDVVQETVGREAVRNATVAFSLAETKLQVLREALEAEGYNTIEVSAKNNCEKHLASFKDQLGRLDVLLREAEGSLDVLLRDAEAFQCVKEAETALKIAMKSLFGSQTQKAKQGDGKITVLNVEYMIDDDGEPTAYFPQAVEAEAENSQNVSKTENQEELPSLYERALNLNTLWHLVDAAKEELQHAKFIRSAIEETMDSTSIVDVIKYDEAVAWEQQASKRLDDANKAVERLEDSYFGNM